MRYFTFGNPTEHVAAAASPFNPGDDQFAWLINPPDKRISFQKICFEFTTSNGRNITTTPIDAGS
jgi:hypothetical protein